MRYDLAKLPINSLLTPLSEAASALARLDERIAHSDVGEGWLARMHFRDACASLWIDGELVDLEDLVLHVAGHDIRAPTHELGLAHAVLTTRRRIATQPTDWPLTRSGLQSLRGVRQDATVTTTSSAGDEDLRQRSDYRLVKWNDDAEPLDPLEREFATLDAVLARTDALLSGPRSSDAPPLRAKDPLLYDPDWDEEARLDDWFRVLGDLADLPPVLATILALDAWTTMQVLQHTPWLGRLLSATLLRRAGLTTAAHLAAINLGLKAVSIERRRHPDRDIRLMAGLKGLIATADLGFKEHDRLRLARQRLDHHLLGRRASSKLPDLVDLVVARPMVTAGTVAEALAITPQAALRAIGELNLREMTGRGSFRAWGIL